jgi:hypothetical protein
MSDLSVSGRYQSHHINITYTKITALYTLSAKVWLTGAFFMQVGRFEPAKWKDGFGGHQHILYLLLRLFGRLWDLWSLLLVELVVCVLR